MNYQPIEISIDNESLVKWSTLDGKLNLVVIHHLKGIPDVLGETIKAPLRHYDVYTLVDGKAYYQIFINEEPQGDKEPILLDGTHVDTLPISIKLQLINF